MDYAISISGQSYTISTSDAAQIAAVAAARVAYNGTLPATVNGAPNPDIVSTDALYLQRVLGVWKATNPDGDVLACAASALASYAGQDIPPPSPEVISPEAAKAQLAAYAETKQTAILHAGVTINGVFVSTTTSGRVDLAGAVSLAQLVPSHTFDWATDAGTIHIPAANIIGMGTAVGLWVQGTYTALGTALSGIADGSITQNSQIDSVFSTIPSSITV